MKLILDTNIWYLLPNNPNLIDEDDKDKVYATFLNYFELLKTRSVVTNSENQRKIIIEMDKFKKLFTSPFVHMAKLHSFYHYNDLLALQDYLDFLVAFKSGDYIDPQKINDFHLHIDSVNQDFADLAKLFNTEAAKIKERIKNNKKHLDSDSSNSTNLYILDFIHRATGRNLDKFEFQKIELFSKTLNLFFKKLEVGNFSATTNDIIDFFMLSYVQPGDLYFTKEKKWMNLIKEAGCENYLYKNCG